MTTLIQAAPKSIFSVAHKKPQQPSKLTTGPAVTVAGLRPFKTSFVDRPSPRWCRPHKSTLQPLRQPIAPGACRATGEEVVRMAAALLPTLWMGGTLFLLMRNSGLKFNMPGKGGFAEKNSDVRFKDVAGVDQAKEELQEVVEFLKNPDSFTRLGAKMPTGCLLVGPPGTGKTMLAQAVAGEAGVPFFAASASEFVEMYVGVGAARVRDLFETARKKQPSIIFIDELDAVGKARGRGLQSNDEREQTINQLLTEMDGFAKDSKVVVIAATNMADSLDDALMRPGRFDRQIYVGLPDSAGREAILRVHAKDKKLGADVDLSRIARRTRGFSGADLANLLNEAAIFARRAHNDEITEKNIVDAYERLIAGAPRPTEMTEAHKRLVAVHEAGHALVGTLCPHYDKVSKVTIVPRGTAGGVTIFEQDEARSDVGLHTRQYFKDAITVALGGRVAEEVVFGTLAATDGASSDLRHVRNLIDHMVEQLGFNDFGPMVTQEGQGHQLTSPQRGNALLEDIDRQKLLVINECYERAKTMVRENRGKLDAIVDILCKDLDVDGEVVRAIVHPL